MSERMAMLPLAVLAIVGAGITLVWAGEALGSWLLKRFGVTGERLGSGKWKTPSPQGVPLPALRCADPPG